MKKKTLLDFIISLILQYNKVKYKCLIMFVYFEVIRMDTDINISEELCLSKVTVSNVQLKIILSPEYTTIRIFPRAQTTLPILRVKWAALVRPLLAEMSHYIVITTRLLSAVLGTLSTPQTCIVIARDSSSASGLGLIPQLST